jgi:PAS domain S-box-containing protein
VGQSEIIPSYEAFINFIHPDDRPAVVSRLEKASAFLENDSLSFRIRRADGQVRFVVTEWRFQFDGQGKPYGIFGIMQDVTEIRLTALALEKSEEKYRSLFSLNPSPMWVYDTRTLQFLDVNEAAIKHYGYSKEEFLAMNLKDIRTEEEIEKLERSRNAAKETRAFYQDIFKHVKKNGEMIDVEIKSTVMDMDGRETRLVIATDISERMRYIQAIREQNEKLREIAWIQSHGVRAPLARMMGLVKLLQVSPPGQHHPIDLLSAISCSAQELDNIIREIVSKTEQIKDHPPGKGA